MDQFGVQNICLSLVTNFTINLGNARITLRLADLRLL